MIDPTNPYLTDLPSEWGVVPPEVLERLLPVTTRVVRGPDGSEQLYDMRGMITPEQKAEIDRIARGRWFLIKGGDTIGERLRCRRCGSRHDYLTLACVERPFHGLQEILGLMKQMEGRDLVFSAVRFGSLEPITRTRALQLIARIRGRGEVI